MSKCLLAFLSCPLKTENIFLHDNAVSISTLFSRSLSHLLFDLQRLTRTPTALITHANSAFLSIWVFHSNAHWSAGCHNVSEEERKGNEKIKSKRLATMHAYIHAFMHETVPACVSTTDHLRSREVTSLVFRSNRSSTMRIQCFRAAMHCRRLHRWLSHGQWGKLQQLEFEGLYHYLCSRDYTIWHKCTFSESVRELKRDCVWSHTETGSNGE